MNISLCNALSPWAVSVHHHHKCEIVIQNAGILLATKETERYLSLKTKRISAMKEHQAIAASNENGTKRGPVVRKVPANLMRSMKIQTARVREARADTGKFFRIADTIGLPSIAPAPNLNLAFRGLEQ
jgi:hypothetical protein